MIHPGDHISVGFGGYGRVIARVDAVEPRPSGALLDVRVSLPELQHTTVIPQSHQPVIYSPNRYGEWL